ncbi:MAG: UDP-N-acetylmuramoyl-L-alanyl-D-glutamate--2,6-diaminopimelate ligase [Firmicutes bacterium]|nr:UDP-N-acetylmuramoyl-L-alanyl-D-glutamate--2,6-diaminopimelate ligase [Bacillota bacterium]
MKLDKLLNGIPHETIQTGSNTEISSITFDSREVKPGSLFLCIRGITIDRHEFINAAAEAGAAAVIVETLSDTYPQNLTVIRVANVRQTMAYIAANYYSNPAKKLRLIGVTGTNGKSTVTNYIEEILRKLGRKVGIIGTVGVKADDNPLNILFATSTTPDPLELHEIFAKFVELGIQDVVMEVSSHALTFYKMEGLMFDVGVFTNLTQDHLDIHGTMINYALAKAKLFEQSKFAVVNSDDEYTPLMLKIHGQDPYLTYGIDTPSDLQAENVNCMAHGSDFELWGEKYHLPVIAKYNVSNILATIGVAKALGCNLDGINQIVAEISDVTGRVQPVPNNIGAQIFVDYAHTPDSLEKTIITVREITTGRVITLFGCGGDRDTTKRPIMGRIAGELSDYCILTSDNPRTEDPFAIIAQTEAGVKETAASYQVCENRKDAIFAGVKMLKPGDALIIAGKGHEDYQEIGKTKYPFSDYETAVEALKSITNGMNLTLQEIAKACNGQILHNVDTPPITSVSTHTKNIAPGALFVPTFGEFFDGHDFINAAAENGAVCALTEKADILSDIPLILVKSTRRALMDLGAYYRRIHNVTVVAITGSAGKTTTKDMIYHVLAHKYKTKKTLGNFNNDMGVPLSIFQLEADDEVLVLEMGMNHAMEIHELSKIGAPDITVITHIGDAHIENFENREGILHAKLEIVDGLKPGGTVILNGDDPLLTGPIAAAKVLPFTVQFPSSKNIISAETIGLQETACHFNWRGKDIKLTVPLPGMHNAMNALLAAAVGVEMGVPPEEIAKGFDDFVPPSGRLTVKNLNGMTVIDDAYNANPAAMRESIKILCKQPGRKVAILGDMNELGHVSEARHTEIGAYAAEMGIDLLIVIGPQAWFLYDAFADNNRKLYFPTVDEFLPKCKGLLQPGDVVLVKASRGMAFERIIDELNIL